MRTRPHGGLAKRKGEQSGCCARAPQQGGMDLTKVIYQKKEMGKLSLASAVALVGSLKVMGTLSFVQAGEN